MSNLFGIYQRHFKKKLCAKLREKKFPCLVPHMESYRMPAAVYIEGPKKERIVFKLKLTVRGGFTMRKDLILETIKEEIDDYFRINQLVAANLTYLRKGVYCLEMDYQSPPLPLRQHLDLYMSGGLFDE